MHLLLFYVVYLCPAPIITWVTASGLCLKPAAEIIGHHCNWWLVVHDPKPPMQFSCLIVITLSVNEISLCFDLITEKDQIRNKASPIIYPSGRQAFSAELLTLKCFPVSALCRLVWTLSIWRYTVKIQSLHWCALWIYTREFITWLASFALFMEQGEWDCNLNADNVVFTLRAIWQHCLRNALVKTPLWVTGGKDNPLPHYCICWTLTVEKNVNCCFNALCKSFSFIYNR